MSEFITKKFAKDQVIFKQGAPGEVAYVLKSGEVEISVKSDNEKINFGVVKVGAVFGEMALILKDAKRSATARATVYSEVVEIPQKVFEDFLKNSPNFIAAVLNAMAGRLRCNLEKSIRTIDLFMSSANILSIMYDHKVLSLKYNVVVERIAAALAVKTKEIENILEVMELFQFININENQANQKCINLVETKSVSEAFLNKASKIHEIAKHNDMNFNFRVEIR